jgi:hypothetical protein
MVLNSPKVPRRGLEDGPRHGREGKPRRGREGKRSCFTEILWAGKISNFPAKNHRDARFVRGGEEHLLRQFDFFGTVPRVGLEFVIQTAINC